MNQPWRLLIVLANRHVSGDATLAIHFARQLGERAAIRAIGQPAAASRLRAAGVTTQVLSDQATRNARRLRRLVQRHRPDLLVLFELRNFADQLRSTAAKAPFVPNLRFSALASLGVPMATLDNLPYDRLGREALSHRVPMIVPVPPLDAGRLRKLDRALHPWAVDYRRARASRVPVRRRKRILLTLSAWATELALAHGLGFYYIVLERQLVGALGELRHPVTLQVVGPAARFFARRTGDVEVRAESAMTARSFERSLYDSDLLITDHVLQHSLVRRVTQGRPALLVRQTLRRGARPGSAEARALVELYERSTGIWPFEIFPLPHEPALDKEPFVAALPKAELFDRGALSRAIARCLRQSSIPIALGEALEAARSEQGASEVVQRILADVR